MQTQAQLRYLRMSARKVRLVANLIRGLAVERALEQLRFAKRRAAGPLIKLLNSAVANASHNHQMVKDNLFIKEIRVDEGPVLKRWRARAFGRAAAIRKRTSHITIVLAEIKLNRAVKERTAPSGKVAKPAKEKLVTKIVKSLDEVKETAVVPAETREIKDNQETQKNVNQDKNYAPGPVDLSQKGKDREKQHLDHLREKGKGGALRRMFRRKSA